jgi:hypothetical protein
VANNHLSPLVLVGNQGRYVRLDTTSSETDNNDSDDEASETRIVVKSRRNGRAGKDEETDDVDTAEDDNGVVLSEILVGNDGTENGSNVAPELEEGGETSGSLVTHTERTTAFRSIAWTSDVVLEDTGGSIVGETFAEFDNGDKESTLGKRLSDLAERPHLLGSRPDTTEAIVIAVDGGVRVDIRMRLLEGDVGAGDIVVVDGGAVEVRLVVGNFLTVLECLGAVRSVRILHQSMTLKQKLTR